MRRNIEAAMLSNYTLSKLPLFQGLTEGELSNLRDHLHIKTVLAGTSITLAGQFNEIIYIILDGVIHLQVEQLRGTIVILATLGPGEMIGGTSLLERREDLASAVTKEDAILLSMDCMIFQEYLKSMPMLTFNLMGMLADRLYMTYKKLQLLAARDVQAKVAYHLISLAERYGEQRNDGGIFIPLRLTQSELADHVGASRVRVNQAIALFKQSHYISIDQSFYTTIHNLTALAAFTDSFSHSTGLEPRSGRNQEVYE